MDMDNARIGELDFDDVAALEGVIGADMAKIGRSTPRQPGDTIGVDSARPRRRPGLITLIPVPAA